MPADTPAARLRHRSNHLRGVSVSLGCGCVQTLASSFYRLTADRRDAIVGSAVRKGVWCENCGSYALVVGVVGTVRL